jgi:WD40 repeat protein
VSLWEIPKGTQRTYIYIYALTTSLTFSPDGKTLVGGLANGEVMFFDAHTGIQFRNMVGHKGAVVGVAFSPDGSTLVSASVNKKIYFWDVNTGERLRMSSDPLLNPQFYCMALSPDGNVIATGSTDKIIRLWDFETGNTLRLLVGEHITTVNSIAFSPDGTMLASSSDATGSEDGKIILWGVSK